MTRVFAWALALAGVASLVGSVACRRRSASEVDEGGVGVSPSSQLQVVDVTSATASATMPSERAMATASIAPPLPAASPATGYTFDPELSKVRRCCMALMDRQRALGDSPEAKTMSTAATRCYRVGPRDPVDLTTFRKALKTLKGAPAECGGI